MTLALLFGCATKTSVPLHDRFMADYILPTHTSFTRHTSALVDASATACASGDTTRVAHLQQAFLLIQRQWQFVQQVEYGPLADHNTAWRLQFWPDRKNLVGKQIEAALASDDPLDAAYIATAPVPMQGIGALEYLLFDSTDAVEQLASNARRCALLHAIAANVHSIAQELESEWRAIARGETPNPLVAAPSPVVVSGADDIALAVIITALAQKTDEFVSRKVEPAYTNRRNVYLLQGWRSQSTLQIMAAQVDALRAIYEAAGVHTRLLVRNPELAERITAEFANVQALLANSPAPLETTLALHTEQTTFDTQLSALQGLKKLLADQLPKAFGINTGFNAHDGD